MSNKMTINIVEIITERVVTIEGDMVAGMKACINRNKSLQQSGMRGKWKLQMDFHLTPEEYPLFFGESVEVKETKLENGFYTCTYGYAYGNHGYVVSGSVVMRFTSQHIDGIFISYTDNHLKWDIEHDCAKKSTYSRYNSERPEICNWLLSLPKEGYYSWAQLNEKGFKDVSPEPESDEE